VVKGGTGKLTLSFQTGKVNGVVIFGVACVGEASAGGDGRYSGGTGVCRGGGVHCGS